MKEFSVVKSQVEKRGAYVLMRVLFCKIHCPSFICFCKPSPHIYTAGPLKLESSPHVPSTSVVSSIDAHDVNHVSDGCGGACGGESTEVKEDSVDGKQLAGENYLKSSLRKVGLDSDSKEEVHKKKVQWMDLLGKELIEIREFEASEVEDSDNDGDYDRGCVCNIL